MLLSHPGPFPSHRARIGSHRHGGHTVITVAVSVLLVVINVTLAPELPWSAFAVAGMVIGLAAHMSIRTIVTADVDQGQAQELVGAFRTLLADGLPDGLLDTQLLGDGEGHWAIHSLWRDQAALDAMRAASQPPAAPALFRRFSAEPALVVMPVLVDSRDTR